MCSSLAKKGSSKTGVTSRKAKFDIHCLRVAGISRLIEIGVDPTIVQEFLAGHLSVAMTHRYLKMQPWHVREKIIEAFVNGDFKSAMDTFADLGFTTVTEIDGGIVNWYGSGLPVVTP